MRQTRRIVLGMVFVLTCAEVAGAQTMLDVNKIFVGVNVGAQTQSREINGSFSFPIYNQTANVTTAATVDGGPIFDASVGYRFLHNHRLPILHNLGLAAGFSSFSVTGSATGAASIPSPIFFNRPASVTLNAMDAKRRDRNVYILFVWFLPVNDRIDVAFSAGPSVTRVQQDLITNVSVPAGTQTATAVLQTQSGTAKGINVGADGTYRFTKQLGVGVFVRYNGGSVDLASASDVKTGGFQLGIGARLRY